MTHNLTQMPHTVFARTMLIALLTVALFAGLSDVASAQEEGDGVVIVQFDDHASSIRPIQISDPISGLAALERSGLDVVTADSGFGPAVCSFVGVGCPADNFFCDEAHFGAFSRWEG